MNMDEDTIHLNPDLHKTWHFNITLNDGQVIEEEMYAPTFELAFAELSLQPSFKKGTWTLANVDYRGTTPEEVKAQAKKLWDKYDERKLEDAFKTLKSLHRALKNVVEFYDRHIDTFKSEYYSYESWNYQLYHAGRCLNELKGWLDRGGGAQN